ncbi:MAG: phosphoribosyltransferase family protein [Clostridiales Family XIII bacterium]|nr:phosphoribosyltransferase family protein [Clostridiales Family XIII bacterium]
MNYTESDLIKIAKRLNNKKRSYLLVNPLQAKHMPVSPRRALEMMDALAFKIHQRLCPAPVDSASAGGVPSANGLDSANAAASTRGATPAGSAVSPGDDILTLGFAETATAIGAAIAIRLGGAYIHTTREILQHADDRLEFLEEHSHATEQFLHSANLKELLTRASHIMLVDDEISTGKTIINTIAALKAYFPEIASKNIFAVSVVNSMRDADISRFAALGINAECLLHIENRDYSEATPQIEERQFIDCRGTAALSSPDGAAYATVVLPQGEVAYAATVLPQGEATCSATVLPQVKAPSSAALSDDTMCMSATANCTTFTAPICISGKIDPRIGVSASAYADACTNLAERVIAVAESGLQRSKSVLVLGTEEFMYPAILTGKLITGKFAGTTVMCHATTRSPIAVSDCEVYPLNAGYLLRSFYSDSRVTHIYNLTYYDTVILITDSEIDISPACSDLRAALGVNGYGKLYPFIWSV